jgi:hypothetical protein
MARTIVVALAVAGFVALGVSPLLAWQCPLQWRAAEEAIKKAEALNVPAEARPLLADAKRLVAESKKHHEGNTKLEHAHSMWKAKAAIAQAEAVITIASP